MHLRSVPLFHVSAPLLRIIRFKGYDIDTSFALIECDSTGAYSSYLSSLPNVPLAGKISRLTDLN